MGDGELRKAFIVGIVGPKSMLDSRVIGNLRGVDLSFKALYI